MSRLDLIVGPNGSGKSTFFELVVAEQRPGTVFVNADMIADEQWGADAEAHGHDAALLADQAREALLANGEPFVAETVGSHPSKVDLVARAKAAGYYVHVIVVAVEEDRAVARVAERKAQGGHGVPEDKIRGRWQRLWPNVAAIIELADTAVVWDTSGAEPVPISTFVAGDPIGSPQWPAWIPADLSARWPG